MEHSPIDELYFKLFGEYPSKPGTALERLATIAYREVKAKQTAVDQRIKGSYSDSTYQIDGLAETDDGLEMIEAKDYTIRNDKVGRNDLQKLSGALLDLKDISKGVFASATDYTKPAKQYANTTPKMPNAKPIDLLDIRPSTELDEKGRIKKICIRINTITPEFEKGTYMPIFTKNGYDALQKDGLLGKPLQIQLENFYDKKKNIVNTFHKLINEVSKNIDLSSNVSQIKGTWITSEMYLTINNQMYELDKIDYSIPISIEEKEFTIENDGTPCLLIRSYDRKIDKLLTDEQLKKYKFNDDGSVTKSN